MSPHRALRRPRCRGFTLLELLLALIVISLVASFAIGTFFDQGDITLHNALRLLAEDLRLAQNRAACLQSPVDVVFDPNGDGYHFEDPGPVEAYKARVFPLVSRRYSADAVFEGVHVLRVDLGGSAHIRYDERGRAQGGGTVILEYRGECRTLELESGRGLTSLPDSPRSRGWLENLR